MKLFSYALPALLAPCAMAQSNRQPLGLTNTIAALSTNTYSLQIPAESAADLALAWSFNLASPGPSNITFTLMHSIDYTNWITNCTIATAANGTNTVVNGTNVNMRGWPALQLRNGANVNTSAVQNLIFYFNSKKGI